MSDADIKLESANLLQPPCSTQPARFIGLTGSVQNTAAVKAPWGVPYTRAGPNTTDLFAGLDPAYRQGYIASHDLSALETTFQNLFQVSYHLIRRDLGVILENQINSSPEMFNRSIAPVEVPQSILDDPNTPFDTIKASTANTMRAATSNDTMMAQWRNSILAMTDTDRVPVFEYLRPVPRLKPLGSAITSVFVSTFAMVSTVWTIFSFVARAFVHSPDSGTSICQRVIAICAPISFQLDSNTPILRERFHLPLYETKRSFEG